MRGFSLTEVMVALVVLTFGLLAAGQMLFVAASSGSLARSKGAAAIAAQDKLESLASLYTRDPLAADLASGSHGPSRTEVVNPAAGNTLNLYSVSWSAGPVPDPRPGKILNAKLVTVTITPSLPGGAVNSKPRLNKVMNVTTILCPGTR